MDLKDIRFILPSKEEIEQELRFRTYFNYLKVTSDFIESEYPSPTILLSNMVNSKPFNNIQGNRYNDLERIGELMRNAWFTEIQMELSSQYREFSSYSNHWLPVQAYYSVYLLLRSLFMSYSYNVNREHASNLRAISEDIVKRSKLYPIPWSVVCVGSPEARNSQFKNLPKGVVVTSVSPLSAPHRVDFWDSYAMFLRTTRFRQYKKQCDDWKRQHNKKRINSKIKQQFIENMAPTSLFHCLYRLRLRSNYSDADSFLLSVHGTPESGEFHSSVRNICWHTLIILETLITRYIGKNNFENIYNQFVRYEKKGLSTDLIVKRWDIIKSLW